MRFLRNVILLTVAALIPCSAAVKYQLSGSSGGAFDVGFEETGPLFISADMLVLAGDLDVCTTTFESCLQVKFEPISSHDAGFSSIEFFTTTTSTLFFFELGAFDAPGSYPTQFGLGDGTLVVSEIQVVPEPSSAMLMFGAVAGLAFVRRLKQ